MGGFVFLYITNPTREEARKIAKHLVRKRLIASANIYSGVNSIYPWEGKLADGQEWILIAKTTREKGEIARKEVERIHSYTIPCILTIPVSPNKKYGEWVRLVVGESKRKKGKKRKAGGG